jgi:hypothetical protein
VCAHDIAAANILNRAELQQVHCLPTQFLALALVAQGTRVCPQVTYSEHSRSKCIGLTIETRPDFCMTPHLRQMLAYGCTRIEMGVQSIYEDVARDTNRGHTVESVKHAFRLSKDAGFKVVAHMMPDLPNVGWDRDVESFREFFENPAFRCAPGAVAAGPVYLSAAQTIGAECDHVATGHWRLCWRQDRPRHECFFLFEWS